MAKHNIGSLVVLRPGDQQYIAGIVTERGEGFLFFLIFFFVHRVKAFFNYVISDKKSTSYLEILQLPVYKKKSHYPNPQRMYSCDMNTSYSLAFHNL